MDRSRIIRPHSPLRAEVRAGADVSRLYADGLGEWLAAVVSYTRMGGARMRFDWPFARPLLREADSTGDNSRTVARAKRYFLSYLGTSAPDDPRSIQVVFANGDRDARWDERVRGTLWGTIKPVARSPERLHVHLGFSLPPGDSPDASHITLLGGAFKGNPTVLVFADPLPSMIRRMSARRLAEVIEEGLPPRARPRWRGLVQALSRRGEMDDIKGMLLLTHREFRDRIGNSRGAMRSGVSTGVMDALEQSHSAGQPSRRSRFKVVSLDDPNAGIKEPIDPSAPAPGNSEKFTRAIEGLDAKTRELIRLRYEEDLTQDQIAWRFGMTQERVAQILSAAHRALRKHFLP